MYLGFQDTTISIVSDDARVCILARAWVGVSLPKGCWGHCEGKNSGAVEWNYTERMNKIHAKEGDYRQNMYKDDRPQIRGRAKRSI